MKIESIKEIEKFNKIAVLLVKNILIKNTIYLKIDGKIHYWNINLLIQLLMKTKITLLK